MFVSVVAVSVTLDSVASIASVMRMPAILM